MYAGHALTHNSHIHWLINEFEILTSDRNFFSASLVTDYYYYCYDFTPECCRYYTITDPFR